MNTIQLNIGLKTNINTNLNGFFVDELVKFALHHHFTIKDYKSRFAQSETEKTLVVSFKSPANEKYIYPIIEFLADALLQDCIAMKSYYVGKLIYSNNPKNDWGEFNEKYFINY